MGPECKGTGIATVKPMVTPRSVETKSMCFFRKSWISRRQSWEETDTPCSTAAARGGGGGGLRPPNSAATTPNRNGGKGGTQHCTAGLLRGQLSFFSAACCNLGRQTSAVFSITTIRLRFSWDDAFWTVGDVRAHR